MLPRHAGMRACLAKRVPDKSVSYIAVDRESSRMCKILQNHKSVVFCGQCLPCAARLSIFPSGAVTRRFLIPLFRSGVGIIRGDIVLVSPTTDGDLMRRERDPETFKSPWSSRRNSRWGNDGHDPHEHDCSMG